MKKKKTIKKLKKENRILAGQLSATSALLAEAAAILAAMIVSPDSIKESVENPDAEV